VPAASVERRKPRRPALAPVFPLASPIFFMYDLRATDTSVTP
jgi:hypothetical protein